MNYELDIWEVFKEINQSEYSAYLHNYVLLIVLTWILVLDSCWLICVVMNWGISTIVCPWSKSTTMGSECRSRITIKQGLKQGKI